MANWLAAFVIVFERILFPAMCKSNVRLRQNPLPQCKRGLCAASSIASYASLGVYTPCACVPPNASFARENSRAEESVRLF